jgi:peptidoglycan/LPS O-acetylase OafA/YrhL
VTIPVIEPNITRKPSLLNLNWMDLLRAVSVCAVIVHHWFMCMEHSTSRTTEFIGTVMGTFVNMFFLLSGCGLVLSHLQHVTTNWREWYRKRLSKIVLPYLFIILLLFLVFLVQTKWHAVSLPGRLNIKTLLVYLLFLQNFFPDMNFFNSALWFMPVLIGLYALFPLLMYVLQRTSLRLFIASTLAATIGFIFLFDVFGYPVRHSSALSLFYISEFSLGMAVGYALQMQKGLKRFLTRWTAIPIGMSLYFISWLMITLWSGGNKYNDYLTTLGLFSLYMGTYSLLSRRFLKMIDRIIRAISKESFYMYILHMPILLYLLCPHIHSFGKTPAVWVQHIAGIFCFLILMYLCALVCRLIYERINPLILLFGFLV